MRMKRSLLALGGIGALTTAGLVMMPSPAAQAHGHVESPPSRQAQCRNGTVECGPIVYEPQSVEGPKGQRNCSAGDARWAELDDDSKGWVATPVGDQVTFTWRFTAPHSTANFEYYIGGDLLATIEMRGERPAETVSHVIDLSRYSGRQKVLAVWNIGDTSNAFYSCVDLDIGGDGGIGGDAGSYIPYPSHLSGAAHGQMDEPSANDTGDGTPTLHGEHGEHAGHDSHRTPGTDGSPDHPEGHDNSGGGPSTGAPSDDTSGGPSDGSAGGTPAGFHEPWRPIWPEPTSRSVSAWQPGVSYAAGDRVTHHGVTYRCWQAHTSQADWEPQNTPALWIRES